MDRKQSVPLIEVVISVLFLFLIVVVGWHLHDQGVKLTVESNSPGTGQPFPQQPAANAAGQPFGQQPAAHTAPVAPYPQTQAGRGAVSPYPQQQVLAAPAPVVQVQAPPQQPAPVAAPVYAQAPVASAGLARDTALIKALESRLARMEKLLEESNAIPKCIPNDNQHLLAPAPAPIAAPVVPQQSLAQPVIPVSPAPTERPQIPAYSQRKGADSWNASAEVALMEVPTKSIGEPARIIQAPTNLRNHPATVINTPAPAAKVAVVEAAPPIKVAPVEEMMLEETIPTKEPPVEAEKLGYFIHSGCFSYSPYANAQEQRIIALDIPVYQKKSLSRGRTLHCVFAGPFATESVAREYDQIILEKGGINSTYVQKYRPETD
ncbi:MAG: hypothetical protein HQL52_13370 [Magnetococcales bacterium]|nr:hypothetical protein [Magnetococcales bacterium]